jgi:hypothetical protein
MFHSFVRWAKAGRGGWCGAQRMTRRAHGGGAVRLRAVTRCVSLRTGENVKFWKFPEMGWFLCGLTYIYGVVSGVCLKFPVWDGTGNFGHKNREFFHELLCLSYYRLKLERRRLRPQAAETQNLSKPL